MIDRIRPSKVRARTVLTVAILAVVIAIAALAKTGPVKGVTGDLGIQAKSEEYTNLFFQDPGYVGKPISTSATGPVRDRVAFVVENGEHRAVDYSWTIQFSPEGRRYSGVTHVAPGAIVSVARTVTLPCGAGPAAGGAGGRTRSRGTAAQSRPTRPSTATVNVRVSLRWPNDSIDFWQACNA